MEKTIEKLFAVIKQRQKDLPEDSYTSSLFKKGRARICQKIGEEGVETALAGMQNSPEQIIYEMADLWYHSLILLADSDLKPEDVAAELQKRFK